MPGAEPFFYPAGRVGCLLLHGFTSSPSELREMGRYLADRGNSAGAPLLPGHGTAPGDLIGYTWHDWYAAALDALAEMRATCEQVYVVGLSLGGALALHMAADRGEELAGVVAMSAPVFFPPGLSRVLRAMNGRVLYLRKPVRDIQDAAARREHLSYMRSPLDATASVVELARLVRTQLPLVQIPALVIQARRDHVVHPLNARIIYSRLGSPVKQLVVLSRGFHIVTVDRDKARVFRSVLSFVRRHSSTGAEDSGAAG
jgi:carboxylesterase